MHAFVGRIADGGLRLGAMTSFSRVASAARPFHTTLRRAWPSASLRPTARVALDMMPHTRLPPARLLHRYSPFLSSAGTVSIRVSPSLAAACSIVRLEREFQRLQRSGAPHSAVVASLYRLLRHANDLGYHSRVLYITEHQVAEEVAQDHEVAREYWRAKDALEEERTRPGRREQEEEQAQSLQQAWDNDVDATSSAPPPPPPRPVDLSPEGRTVFMRFNNPFRPPPFSGDDLIRRDPREQARQKLLIYVIVFCGITVIYLYAPKLTEWLKEVTGLKDQLDKHQEMMKIRSKEFQPAVVPTTRLSDVVGCDEAKAEMSELVEFLKDPTKFTGTGGKMPRGFLLLGPPGTGKTLLARAVAGESGVPFFSVTGADFDQMYVGIGAKRVRDLFAQARTHKKAIIFIDEIDSIGGKRDPVEQFFGNAARETLNQLLAEMDGFGTEGRGGAVVVIAATNFEDKLDPALLRPGRFDRHIEVPVPDIRGRREILRLYGAKLKLDQAVNLDALARGTPGMTGADLSQLLNLAALRASAAGKPAVLNDDLEYAKDRVMLGVERSSGTLTLEMRRHLAYYNAGHSLVALHTPAAEPLHKVTILQRGEHLGRVSHLPSSDTDDSHVKQTYAEMLASLDLRMAGRVAEEIIYGAEGVTSHAARDLEMASHMARQMVTRAGFGAQHGPVADDPGTGEYAERASHAAKLSVDSEVRQLLADSQLRVRALLQQHQSELHRVADALLRHETLDAQQVRLAAQGN